MLKLAPLLLLALLPGCAARLAAPDLGGIYSRAAAKEGPDRNPVVVIPGILGSRLVDDESGALVWGAFGRGGVDASAPGGARLLALPMTPGAALRELTDRVRPDGVLDRTRVDVLGLPFELNAYIHLLATLGAGGYRDQQLAAAGAVDYGDEHFTCFQFAYDWRRDNAENAQRLHAFLLEKKAYVEAERRRRYGAGGPPVKFDLVAHSMGGLVARYYLMFGDADLPESGDTPKPTWAGAALVERAVLVGTPNAGSVKSLRQLVDGARFGWYAYDAAVLGTMPSIYELLPRPRHARVVVSGEGDVREPIDVYDADAWERFGWGLLDPAQSAALARLLPDVPDPAERRRIATDHLRKCLARAEQFAAALDQPAAPPPGLDLHLFAGDAERTPDVVEVDSATGRVRFAAFAPGDGTVTRASAVLDERVGGVWAPALRTPIGWRQLHFLFTDHLGLTRDPGFSDNVLFLLLENSEPLATGADTWPTAPSNAFPTVWTTTPAFAPGIRRR